MPDLLYEKFDTYAVFTMNRPERLNALGATLNRELSEAVKDFTRDPKMRAGILTGSGRAFSAGADLSGRPLSGRTYQYGFRGLVDVVIDFPKPFILAVNGLGVGWGATVVGLADAAFMAESARLRCPFSTLGLTAEGASTYTFPRIMGPQAAARFLLGAEWWPAAQCKADRLALDVFPDEGFLDRVLDHARALARLPMASLLETKSLLVGPHRAAMHQANNDENAALGRLSGGPANLEAVSAFREKRAADFSSL